MRRTAHNIGKVGHAVMAGEHLEPANESDFTPVRKSLADMTEAEREAFFAEADRAPKRDRFDPLSLEFQRHQAEEHRVAAIRGSL